jgi:hypothetical protein
MDIEPIVLIIYAIVWTVFYFFLSNYIAELSRKKWTDWVVSDDSDDVLMDALSVIVDEIEDRMHDKLEHFQKSFFGSLGNASKKLDASTGATTIKAITKDNPVMGFVAEYLMKRGGLEGLMDQNRPNNAPNTPKISNKLGL